MGSNLLYVPFRKTEDIDLRGQIESIISKEYFQTATSFETDTKYISQLRLSLSNLGGDIEDDDSIILKTYFIHLSTLHLKFPKDAVEFSWFGTLGHSVQGPIKIKSFLFERINILYNLGALFSQQGASESGDTDEGLKRGCVYFQHAAGCFELIGQLIKDNKNEHLQLPSDLQLGTIEPLKYLMLAHAQEVFWQKAVANKLRDSVIARLALSVSDFYSLTLEAASKSDVIKSDWIRHITVKKFHFKVAAEYRAALAASSSFNYGEEVARLRIASKCCDMGMKNIRYVSEVVAHDLKCLKDAVVETLQRAERDNDLIYLKPIPGEKDLLPIVKAPMVKALIDDDLANPLKAIKTNKYGNLLFGDLLPYIVIQSAQAFRERQESFINQQLVNPINALSSMFIKFLNERNLPAAIDAIQKPESIPDTIIQHSQEIISTGGINTIKESLTDIQKVSMKSSHLVDGVRERLSIEASEDKILRERQGSQRWTRVTSEEAASQLAIRLAELAGLLEQAKNGDQIIRNRYYEIESYIEIYCGGLEILEKFIPDSKFVKVRPEVNSVIIELRSAMNKSQKLEDSRKQFLETVESKSRDTNILPKVISEYRRIQSDSDGILIGPDTFENVYEKHIAAFNVDITKLQMLRDEQTQLESKIHTLHKEFIKTQSNKEVHSERQDALQTLENAHMGFKSLVANLTEGMAFYGDFVTKASELLRDCDEFVYERRIEARELENELNNNYNDESFYEENDEDDEEQNSYNVSNESVHSIAPPKIYSPKPNPGVWNPNQGIKFG